MQVHKEAGVINPTHSKAALEGDGWSTPDSDLFASGKGSTAFVKEDDYTSGCFWTARKIRSPHLPARRNSIFRVGYPELR